MSIKSYAIPAKLANICNLVEMASSDGSRLVRDLLRSVMTEEVTESLISAYPCIPAVTNTDDLPTKCGTDPQPPRG